MEVSSHALSQNRVDNIEFDFTGFTNLTLDHLDYHGTIDSYFNEKKKLFGLVKDSGSSLILNDGIYGRYICSNFKNTNTVSFKNVYADFQCEKFNLEHDSTNARFNLKGTYRNISIKRIVN